MFHALDAAKPLVYATRSRASRTSHGFLYAPKTRQSNFPANAECDASPGVSTGPLPGGEALFPKKQSSRRFGEPNLLLPKPTELTTYKLQLKTHHGLPMAGLEPARTFRSNGFKVRKMRVGQGWYRLGQFRCFSREIGHNHPNTTCTHLDTKTSGRCPVRKQ